MKNSLQFKIGENVYRVMIAANVCRHGGKPVEGIITEQTRMLWLSPDVLPSRRIFLLHWHLAQAKIWADKKYLLAGPQICDFISDLTESIDTQLDEQGGIDALCALKPNPEEWQADDNSDDEASERIGEEWKGDAMPATPRTPATPAAVPLTRDSHERLPEAERVSNREFYELIWAGVAPMGLPLPLELPSDFRISMHPFPAIVSGNDDECVHCPVCGKGYKIRAFYAAHLIEKHGWKRDATTLTLIPPMTRKSA